MIHNERYAAFASAGYRVNEEAGVIDGLCHGIAWRLTLTEGVLDMAVRVSEKALQQWRRELTGDAAVAYHGSGVRLTDPSLSILPDEDLLRRVDSQTAYAERAAEASFDDSFERYGESAWAYVRGTLGALLGAAVGTLPVLLDGWLGYSLWFLGIFISMGAYAGYRLACGAHSTRFAVGMIVAASLLMAFTGAVLDGALWLSYFTDVSKISFSEALAWMFNPEGYLSQLLHTFTYMLLSCALGFVGIRRKVMTYTHETRYLRRKK